MCRDEHSLGEKTEVCCLVGFLLAFQFYSVVSSVTKPPALPLGSTVLKQITFFQWPNRGLNIFTGRTDAEAETPILWPPDAKN